MAITLNAPIAKNGIGMTTLLADREAVSAAFADAHDIAVRINEMPHQLSLHAANQSRRG